MEVRRVRRVHSMRVREHPDTDTHGWCLGCEEYLPLPSFPRYFDRGTERRHSRCFECRRGYYSDWKKRRSATRKRQKRTEPTITAVAPIYFADAKSEEVYHDVCRRPLSYQGRQGDEAIFYCSACLRHLYITRTQLTEVPVATGPGSDPLGRGGHRPRVASVVGIRSRVAMLSSAVL